MTARCADGTRISFRIAGNDKGPRIALVHSLAMDHTFWLAVVERMTEEASLLIYDCRGHGMSEKPAGPYTTRLFAADLADLMNHIGWRSATVAGASMGGCVALAFAAQYPQRTNALGLIDTTAWYGADAPAHWAARANTAASEGLEGLVKFQITRWFSEKFRREHPDVVHQCVKVFLANDPAAYGETCRMLGAHNLVAALPSITCPTAVIVGEEDYATPVAMARVLHDGIKGSIFLSIKNAQHLTPLETPDVIATELKALLKRSPP